MNYRILALTALLCACQSRNQTPSIQPAAEGPPIKRAVKTEAATTSPKPQGPGKIAIEHSVAWLKTYMLLGEALVHSDPVKAADHATSMISTGPPDGLKSLMANFPKDLKGQRLRFAKLSAEAHKLWKTTPELQKDTAVMHCPMVPADWIQPAERLRNPYMPETMLRCGYQVLPEQ